MNTDSLFKPFNLKSLSIKNRIVMAPMTRSFSPDGIPTDDVADYYEKRAEGEVGLILSEGTVIDRVSSSNDANVPHFYGDKALAGWKNVIDKVHNAGGAMAPQIWHMGIMDNHQSGWVPSQPFEGPSGLNRPGNNNGKTMTEKDIEDAIIAYGKAAADAKRLGFNSVEIHGAHWLNPLADAGVDIFHCSQRRFWEPEFEGSDLNFAGWAKKLSGKPTITVGSVGLTGEFLAAFAGESSEPSSLEELLRRMDRGDFDLVAVGRPLLSDPNWVKKIKEGRTEELKGFTKEALGELVMS
ncbi:MAG: 12-oxophytodienoate reductase [Pedobacter sp.]|nr:MAG: 12-oxophytodienoate reductase [Pedobacter sp.]